MKKNNYAYLAGVFDGEGSILLIGNNSRTKYRYLGLGVVSTTKELVIPFEEAFGGAIYQRRKTVTGKPVFNYSINGLKAFSALKKLFPYIREPEKKRKAKLVLSKYKSQLSVNPRSKCTKKQIKAKKIFEKEFFKFSSKYHDKVQRVVTK